MLTNDNINQLIGIKESYQASDRLMALLFDRGRREALFKKFLALEKDVSYDWFHEYFQDEHADRKVHKQDFTPKSIADVLIKAIGNSGVTLDIAAGTGGMTIRKWWNDCLKETPFSYLPANYMYQCEELSDRALPFLLFNLLIRGMNATVVHGDVLSRKIKQIYFIQNEKNNHLGFSSLNMLPHNKTVCREFDVHAWLEPELNYIESVEFPKHLRLGGVEG
ncbi:SAM-dependent DNA methyltransferase [Listeria booriae]|uniref:SAM-dependent DNA methyltransferase n=1 Tax=Listeria booriae TaxID=1552123 RepID=UPI00164E4519|nr:SAM-dependent DNA methyltransferase [Listeria booriae]MBC6151059.1 SAM-dependent DNA methyltransferase [Listeria booriae]MBC6151192.1 SAM-dependent DNA methyltransferase [Listeria booriae]